MQLTRNETLAIQYNRSIAPIISQLCEPLFKNFSIDSFSYVKMFDDKMLDISHYTEWTEFHITNKLHELDYYQEHISKMGNGKSYAVLWDNVVSNATSGLVDAMHAHDIRDSISIYKKYDTYVEMWNFATKQSNSEVLTFYLNNMDLLERFIVYFKTKGAELMDVSDKNKLLHRKEKINLNLENAMIKKQEQDFLMLTTLNKLKIQNNGGVAITQREGECLSLLSLGKSAKQIGLLLKISSRTVESHINQLKLKLECHHKSELINIFERNFKGYFKL